MNTNVEMLDKKISESGIKRYKIAEALNLTRQGFINKTSGATDFKVSEMIILCNMLKLSEKERNAIFFANIVD